MILFQLIPAVKESLYTLYVYTMQVVRGIVTTSLLLLLLLFLLYY